MMNVTVGTFNLRNLFSQFNFEAKIDEIIDFDGGTLEGELKYEFGYADTIKIRDYRGSLVKGKKEKDTEKKVGLPSHRGVNEEPKNEGEDRPFA